MLRFKLVFITATRGTSKSYSEHLCGILECVFYPGIKLDILAPGKEQAAKISQACIEDILEHYPLLRNEIKTYKPLKDETYVIFFNGSKYRVVQLADAARGGRTHGLRVDEIGSEKFDGDKYETVIYPRMSNFRRAANGKVAPQEIHKKEIFVGTACPQQRYGYKKLMQVCDAMSNGESAFVLGSSYEMPCLYGQLDIDDIESKKDSSTMSTQDYMMEYESIYIGSSDGALVSETKLRRCRNLGIAEWGHCGDSNAEYILSYDVARNPGKANALSCLHAIKITPRSDGTYLKELVNTFSAEGTHETIQAKFLKQKVFEYKARILIIDAQGIGSGVVDQLVLDLNDGYPPFGVVNNNDYDRFKGENSIPIVFAMKSVNKETRNSDMINNFMAVFNKQDISLLKLPHEGIKDLRKKMRLSATEMDEKAELEIPYVYTNLLCEEIMNLEYKPKGMEASVKQVSPSIPKDKFSALMYGLWWINMQEKINLSKSKPAQINARSMFKARKPNIYSRKTTNKRGW